MSAILQTPFDQECVRSPTVREGRRRNRSDKESDGLKHIGSKVALAYAPASDTDTEKRSDIRRCHSSQRFLLKPFHYGSIKPKFPSCLL